MANPLDYHYDDRQTDSTLVFKLDGKTVDIDIVVEEFNNMRAKLAAKPLESAPRRRRRLVYRDITRSGRL